MTKYIYTTTKDMQAIGEKIYRIRICRPGTGNPRSTKVSAMPALKTPHPVAFGAFNIFKTSSKRTWRL